MDAILSLLSSSDFSPSAVQIHTLHLRILLSFHADNQQSFLPPPYNNASRYRLQDPSLLPKYYPKRAGRSKDGTGISSPSNSSSRPDSLNSSVKAANSSFSRILARLKLLEIDPSSFLTLPSSRLQERFLFQNLLGSSCSDRKKRTVIKLTGTIFHICASH